MHLQSGFQYDGAVLDVFRLLKKTRTPTKKGGGAGRVKKTPSWFREIIVPSNPNTSDNWSMRTSYVAVGHGLL